jgi:N-acetylmuramic acid 6-phosphate etherase
MRATNDKLRMRQVRILREATGEPGDACEAALAEASGDLRVALVMLVSGAGQERAAAALAVTDGGVRTALAELGVPRGRPAPSR